MTSLVVRRQISASDFSIVTILVISLKFRAAAKNRLPCRVSQLSKISSAAGHLPYKEQTSFISMFIQLFALPDVSCHCVQYGVVGSCICHAVMQKYQFRTSDKHLDSNINILALDFSILFTSCSQHPTAAKDASIARNYVSREGANIPGESIKLS